MADALPEVCAHDGCNIPPALVPRIKHGPGKWQDFPSAACCRAHSREAGELVAAENTVDDVAPCIQLMRITARWKQTNAAIVTAEDTIAKLIAERDRKPWWYRALEKVRQKHT